VSIATRTDDFTIGATVAPSLARRIDVARIQGTTLTLFRDGTSASTFDLTGRGPITETAPLKLGNPCDHYAFAAWDRAAQVQAELDRLAGPVVPPAPVSVTDDPETAANGSGSAAPAKAKRARKR